MYSIIARFIKYTVLLHQQRAREGDVPKKSNFLVLQIGKCRPKGDVVDCRLINQEAEVPWCFEPVLSFVKGVGLTKSISGLLRRG
jgi:hypothetical protein